MTEIRYNLGWVVALSTNLKNPTATDALGDTLKHLNWIKNFKFILKYEHVWIFKQLKWFKDIIFNVILKWISTYQCL